MKNTLSSAIPRFLIKDAEVLRNKQRDSSPVPKEIESPIITLEARQRRRYRSFDQVGIQIRMLSGNRYE